VNLRDCRSDLLAGQIDALRNGGACRPGTLGFWDGGMRCAFPPYGATMLPCVAALAGHA